MYMFNVNFYFLFINIVVMWGFIVVVVCKFLKYFLCFWCLLVGCYFCFFWVIGRFVGWCVWEFVLFFVDLC